MANSKEKRLGNLEKAFNPAPDWQDAAAANPILHGLTLEEIGNLGELWGGFANPQPPPLPTEEAQEAIFAGLTAREQAGVLAVLAADRGGLSPLGFLRFLVVSGIWSQDGAP